MYKESNFGSTCNIYVTLQGYEGFLQIYMYTPQYKNTYIHKQSIDRDRETRERGYRVFGHDDEDHVASAHAQTAPNTSRPGQYNYLYNVSRAQGENIPDKQLQNKYRAIKDSVQKVRIPNDFKSNDSNKGIKRTEQSKAAVVNTCSGYSETLLKILLSIDNDQPLGEDNMNMLMSVNTGKI